MTSQCNRKTIHASTIYPTHPKFGKVITCKLSQKTTPQVRQPVIIAVHVCVNKIHVHNKKLTTSKLAFSQITKPHPSTQQYKGQKQVALKPQLPTKQTPSPTNTKQAKYIPANLLKNKITPKASQTAYLNCLNFKLTVPAPKLDHTQNSCPTRSGQPQPYFFTGSRTPNP